MAERDDDWESWQGFHNAVNAYLENRPRSVGGLPVQGTVESVKSAPDPLAGTMAEGYLPYNDGKAPPINPMRDPRWVEKTKTLPFAAKLGMLPLLAVPWAVETLGGGAWSGLTLPGEILSGKVKGNSAEPGGISDEVLGRGLDTIGLFGSTAFAKVRPENSLGTFGGVRAKTANLEKLAEAQSLEGIGVPREDIWSKTGWFRGADDQWRFNIPDDGAHLSTTAQNRIERDGSIKAGGMPGYDHPALFDAYPELRTRSIDGDAGGALGISRPGEGIGVDLRRPYFEKQRTVLHEFQHQVQDIEGFAKGGQSREFARGDLELENASEHLSNTILARGIQEEAAKRGISVDDLLDLARKEDGIEFDAWVVNSARHVPTESLTKRIELTQREIEHARNNGYEGYRRLAGEVEARNTAERSKLTREERIKLPPWLTEEVDPSLQIVRGTGNGISGDNPLPIAAPAANVEPPKKGGAAMPDVPITREELGRVRQAEGIARKKLLKEVYGFDVENPQGRSATPEQIAAAAARMKTDPEYAPIAKAFDEANARWRKQESTPADTAAEAARAKMMAEHDRVEAEMMARWEAEANPLRFGFGGRVKTTKDAEQGAYRSESESNKLVTDDQFYELWIGRDQAIAAAAKADPVFMKARGEFKKAEKAALAARKAKQTEGQKPEFDLANWKPGQGGGSASVAPPKDPFNLPAGWQIVPNDVGKFNAKYKYVLTDKSGDSYSGGDTPKAAYDHFVDSQPTLARSVLKLPEPKAAVLPGLHSAAREAIVAAPQNTATGSQWAGMLKNKGIKAEELDTIGLTKFMDENANKVISKEALAQEAVRGGPKIEEVVKKGGQEMDRAIAGDIADETWDVWAENFHDLNGHRPSRADWEQGGRDEHIDDIIANSEDYLGAPNRHETKFATYQLPGGENYREILFTMPGENLSLIQQMEALNDPVVREIKSLDDVSLARRHSASFRVQAKDLTNEQVWNEISEFRANPRQLKDDYTSSHWDEPNVVAHKRINDRVIDGEPTTFLEEAQSDLHQAAHQARQKEIKRVMEDDGLTKEEANKLVDPNFGYKNADTQRRYEEARKLAEASRERLADISIESAKKATGYTMREFLSTNPTEAQKARWHSKAGDYRRDDPVYQKALEEHDRLVQASQEAAREYGVGKVPDFPFKKTWPDLILKRLVREAVDTGKTQIAWTDGATQAARYDLSKQVDRVIYAPKSNELEAFKDGRSVIRETVPPEKLPDFIGKEAADKILNNPTEKTDAYHKLSGVDLKVGGEGMKGFYDKILPTTAKKLFGKYGTKVETSKLNVAVASSDELDRLFQKRGIKEFRVDEPSTFAIDALIEKDYSIQGAKHLVEMGILDGETTPKALEYLDSWSTEAIKEFGAPTTSVVHILKLTPELIRAAKNNDFSLFASGVPLPGAPDED